ncbi:uncharacterized protein RJT21DRAFT_112364 [Scheffersomyces amazonensis]|uniref:uncharacterized protein n=1 Tax=Scheffersomyces amazonensis TaxID=1078765 RepID=UPI00315D8E15
MGSSSRVRPMSLYVTPPLDINYDFENDSSPSPLSAVSSEHEQYSTRPSSTFTSTPPVSTVTHTPPSSPKSSISKLGIFRRLSSKFSTKTKSSNSSITSGPSSTFLPISPISLKSFEPQAQSSSIQSSPSRKRFSQDLSILSPRLEFTSTQQTPPKSRRSSKSMEFKKEKESKRFSIHGTSIGSKRLLPAAIMENSEEMPNSTRESYPDNNITRLTPKSTPDSNNSVIENHTKLTPTSQSKPREDIIKLNIFFEDSKSEKKDFLLPEEFDYIALKLRKDKLNNLNELVNVIIYKLLAKKHDLNINEVKLLIFFKDKGLNPIVLKQSSKEIKSQHKQLQKPFNLKNDELLLDYIKLKKKLYIMAQI